MGTYYIIRVYISKQRLALPKICIVFNKKKKNSLRGPD